MTAKKSTEPRRAYRQLAAAHKPQERDSGAIVSEKQRKVECARLNRTFGERMYRARHEINNWTQQHAAKLLGYATSSPLAKIEAGGKFPIWLPPVAARVYGVTIDYLMGVTDFEFECRKPGSEWEQSVLDANKAFMQIMMQDHAKHLAHVAKTTGVSVDGLATVMAKAANVKEIFDRVCELNPGIWAEARGGSRLETAISDLQACCQEVRRTAQRVKVQLKVGAYAAGVSELVNHRLDFQV